MSNKILLLLSFFVISGCKLPEKPHKANKYIVKDIISQAAEDSLCPQVTPNLLKAIASVETQTNAELARFEVGYMKKISGSWDELKFRFENAVSHGETQILGKTARAYGVEPEEVRKDKETAYRLTALILGTDICGNFDGDLAKGVASYNAGPTWMNKKPEVRKKALAYVEKVKKIMGIKEWNRTIGLRKKDSRKSSKVTLARL